ncbi:DegT/DnrJ/EryC1/StrS family aminotransferase [soil metagenome]
MIPHNKPTLGEEETLAASRVFASGWLAQGMEVEHFENELCAFLGLPAGHAVALSSGTAALFMSLWVLQAKGKCVAFPAYACAALPNAVAMAGATECVLDVAAGSPNLDLQIAARSGADILIAPHMYGLPMDLSKLDNIAVIEDCAQSLGAKVNGIAAGLQTGVGIFSFYATKLITTGGQGGALISRDKSLVDQVRDYREFDCRRDGKHRFNFQMTDLQAAVGRAQLVKLPDWLAQRARLFAIYRDAGLDLLDVEAGQKIEPVRYRAVVKTSEPQRVVAALADKGVKAIIPLEDCELLGDGKKFPHALALTRSTVSLPVYPTLAEHDAEKIAHIVRGIVRGVGRGEA